MIKTAMDVFSALLAIAEEHAAVLLLVSIATLVMTFVMLPIMITRLPKNYFVEEHRPPPMSRHLVVHLFMMAAKNVVGLAFVVLGIILLFLPGQGVLTLFIGLTIMNYPGKFALERWLAMRPRVLPALNWLRARHDQPPLDDP